MKRNLIIFFSFLPFLITAQLTENFSDGNFTDNPVWSGTTADFIVNANQQLQTNSDVAATSYLVTPNLLTDLNGTEWSFYLKQSFAGSGSNFTKVYLTADNADLNNVQNGYYLLFGEAGSTDAIRLFKVDSGLEAEILVGNTGNIANSFGVSVKVLHTTMGKWELYTDYTGGNSYSLEASSGVDNTPLNGGFFGIFCKYTVSNIKKIYFDDLYIGDIIVDKTAPAISSVQVVDSQTVNIAFSEAVNVAILNENILMSPNLSIDSVFMPDVSSIQIRYTTIFTNGTTYIGTIPNVKDLEGNDTTLIFKFTYLVADTPSFGDVVISEFMSDPTPTIGLPEAEYVEIYNRSNKIFNVKDWMIKNNGTSVGKLKEKWFLPGTYIAITSTSNDTLFQNGLGATSFPSLKNAGDDIILTGSDEVILDRLTYNADWMTNTEKKDGGYSFERVQLHVSCSDRNNWKYSENPLGGTPGFVNSVNDETPDVTVPSIKEVIANSDTTMTLIFSEPLASIYSVTQFTISPNVPIMTATQDTSDFSIVYLLLSSPLTQSSEYTLTVTDFTDCQGNSAATASISFVMPATPQHGDLIFNELLFNPMTGGSDFIEIKNISDKIFNLKNLQLTNTKSGNSNNVTIQQNYFIYPKEIVVLTPDSTFQKENYPFHGNGNYIQMGIPTMTSKSDAIILLADSVTIDSLTYDEKWHFKLLTDFKGKSLERVNDNTISTLSSSWHTASESVGFATPGIENSQSTAYQYNGQMFLNSETFSPDNDGFEDFLTITYEMDSIGYVGSVKIYDDRGRLIRELIQNELLGVRGEFVWDGLNDRNQKAHVGTYVIVFSGYHVDSGKTFKMKKVAVIAGNI